jgi:predicted short-subunit dehydrogenase-like oxidoreductase (DUF2520 family)
MSVARSSPRKRPHQAECSDRRVLATREHAKQVSAQPVGARHVGPHGWVEALRVGLLCEPIGHVSLLSQSPRIAIIGAGRVGNALADGLRRGDHLVVGPLARAYPTEQLADIDMVLLCVPDREIKQAAATLARCLHRQRRSSHPSNPDDHVGTGLLVGHCSGATTLAMLEPFRERFSLHPLIAFAAANRTTLEGATDATAAGQQSPDGSTCVGFWRGASAALAGSTPRALAGAQLLASLLGLRTFIIDDGDRTAYHAAASMASNFLITLEAAAERLAASAGCPRESLVQLVRQTVENWAYGGSDALTGPIVRGDTATVARQRDAVAERAPELLTLFDALSDATRDLVGAARS